MQCSGHAVHGGDGGVELAAVVIRDIAAHGPPDLEPADLAEVVRASASHVVGPGEAGRIVVDAPDAVVIRMDPEQIERVLTTCSGTLCSMHRGDLNRPGVDGGSVH